MSALVVHTHLCMYIHIHTYTHTHTHTHTHARTHTVCTARSAMLELQGRAWGPPVLFS